MNRYFQNNIVNIAKYYILQDDTIRSYADIISKTKTLFTVNQICNYKAYCEKMPLMIVSNMYPSLTYEQRQQLLHFFHHQKAECERALQKLSEEVSP